MDTQSLSHSRYNCTYHIVFIPKYRRKVMFGDLRKEVVHMDCNNLCFHSERHCEYCKKNYDVSSELYKGKRPANGCYVVGYLVKNKQGEIQGILNKDTHFAELAWIDEDTIEKI